ncbi:hypothetical protein [Chitinophaga nivalis]|uniref:DUF4595 domain-containing protein n=1 Tax=Chitinophaga nivalis TaxID=2991709 RepID=A0ABT3IFW9_9BACT|nr:hypothetical protein [Chitinophaga nivalis]MCW3467453.1 hypothetical protein [Chitinophaga nivalis]MCW3482855.1 hypothetical protein [Chitinophaga nivalis]
MLHFKKRHLLQGAIAALLLATVACSKKEDTTHEPIIDPVVPVTGEYLLRTLRNFDGTRMDSYDSLVYNDKNQLTDFYTYENETSANFSRRHVYVYDNAGKVSWEREYRYNDNGKLVLQQADSVGWAPGKLIIYSTFPLRGEKYSKDTTTYLLSNNGVIVGIAPKVLTRDHPTAKYMHEVNYQLQGKDVAKITSRYFWTDNHEAPGETSLAYEYDNNINPFHRIFLQNPLFFTQTYYSTGIMLPSEHNVTKEIVTPVSETNQGTTVVNQYALNTTILEKQELTVLPSKSKYTIWYTYIKAK